MNKLNSQSRKAYIIGGGIAGLATATFLIKDGGMRGNDIFILDHKYKIGGSFDGRGSAKAGYLCRGYRMYEKSIYSSTYNLLSQIPSPQNHSKNLKDDFFEFNQKIKIDAHSRLIEDGRIINAHKMQLSWGDRLQLIKLLLLPEKIFEKLKISDYFNSSIFKTNFWFEFSTTFAFQSWHSLVEMKRYMIRFIHVVPQMDTMSCVWSAPYCENDFMISPLQKMLTENKVNFRAWKVIDVEFDRNINKKFIKNILISGNEKNKKINIEEKDLVFITNGSMITDSSIGSMTKPPPTTKLKSDSWTLWKKIARNSQDFGNPHIFCNSIKKSKWESFTITFNDSKFFKLIENLSRNKAGTGGIITLKSSNWKISILLPYQPYFINQPKNTFVCWGYGLSTENVGNYVNKKMSDCNGKEILEELCHHLRLENEIKSITKNSICIPAMLPYIGSQFMPRDVNDRPRVIPKNSKNFAFIGQYVEIPHEISFTVECSIRSAKIAVKKLLNLPNKIPPLYQKQYNPKLAFRAIKTILR